MDVTVARRVRNKDYFQISGGGVVVPGGGSATPSPPVPSGMQVYTVEFQDADTTMIGGVIKYFIIHNKDTTYLRCTVYDNTGRLVPGVGWHPAPSDPTNIAILDINQIIKGTWKILIEYYLP